MALLLQVPLLLDLLHRALAEFLAFTIGKGQAIIVPASVRALRNVGRLEELLGRHTALLECGDTFLSIRFDRSCLAGSLGLRLCAFLVPGLDELCRWNELDKCLSVCGRASQPSPIVRESTTAPGDQSVGVGTAVVSSAI